MKSSGKRVPESGAELWGRNFSGLSGGIEEGGVRLPARSPGVPDSAFAGKGGRRGEAELRRSPGGAWRHCALRKVGAGKAGSGGRASGICGRAKRRAGREGKEGKEGPGLRGAGG